MTPLLHERGSNTIASWLPLGFSFLSGLPEAQRRRRLLMPIQVYVDESGGRSQGQYFVMAGLISPAEKWGNFSEEWRACLDSKPKMRAFKMSDMAGHPGRRLGGLRDQKLVEFAQIMNRYVEAGIYVEIEVEPFYRIFQDFKPKRRMDWLYYYAFHTMVMGVFFDQRDAGLKERFEIIFDENGMHGARTKRYYPLTREFLIAKFPESDSLLPIDAVFRDDSEFVPLQGSDMLAWSRLRAGDDFKFEFMLKEMSNIRLSGRSCTLNEEHLKKIRNGDRSFLDSPQGRRLREDYKELLDG